MKAIVYMFFFFMLFPYIDFINIGTDTQPNTLVLAGIIAFGLKDKRLNGPIILLWILFGLSLVMMLTSKLPLFVTLKNVINYLAPAIFCFVSYNIFKRTQIKLPFKGFMAALWVYFFVAYMQMYFITDFMSFLVGTRGIMFGGRGVVSLTPEPAFYGTMMLFLMIFSVLYYDKKQNMIAIPLMLFQLVFFSKTTTAIGMTMIALGIFGLIQVLKFNLKAVTALVLGLVVLAIGYNKIRKDLEETRIGQIVEQLIDDPWLLALVDESASVRITSSYAPFMSMKHNYFLPMGFGRFQTFMTKLYHQGHYRKLLTERTVTLKEKIGGGINMVLFHLGFLGLIFPLAIYLSFRRLLYRPWVQYCLILFFLLLFTQMQLLNAIIGVIIGTALYKSKELEMLSKTQSTLQNL